MHSASKSRPQVKNKWFSRFSDSAWPEGRSASRHRFIAYLVERKRLVKPSFPKGIFDPMFQECYRSCSSGKPPVKRVCLSLIDRSAVLRPKSMPGQTVWWNLPSKRTCEGALEHASERPKVAMGGLFEAKMKSEAVADRLQ
jgi:hypothetical protein